MATISIHHVKTALTGLNNHGFSNNEVLIEAGINPKLLELPTARVSENQMSSLVQQIRKVLDDEFMGFTKTACKLGAFEHMVESVRRCDNLREALQMGMSFYNLLTDDIHTTLLEQGNQAIIIIDFAHTELDPEYFYLEFWMIIWHRLASWIIGTRIPLNKTLLIHKVPKHANELSVMFPGPLLLNSNSNELQFDAYYLDQHLIRTPAEIDDFLIHAPADLLTIPDNQHSLQNRITRLLDPTNQSELSFPSISALAKTLNISPQTLHRKLNHEGVSYQKIKDNIRRDVALTKLIQERLPVHHVAAITGFSESRSFTRAFKRWTGLSPREYCRFI